MSNSIFDWFQLIAENVWLYGGAFVLVLSVLVFVHEWGHYYVARKCGVKIDSFSIGFGPEIFGFTDKRGTRWKFSVIPLGGYVKMFGDVDPASAGHVDGVEGDDGKVRKLTKKEKEVAFFSQSVAKRSAIVVAGPAINFLFAIFILACLYSFYGQPVTPAIGSAVIAESAADEAGFEPHDVILAIDGEKIKRFEDIRREVMIGLDTVRTFTVERNGAEFDIVAAPRKLQEEDHFGFKHSKGLLGLLSPGNAIAIPSIIEINGEPMEDEEMTRQSLQLMMGTTFRITLNSGGTENDVLIVRPLADFNEGMLDPANEEYNFLVLANTREEILMKHGIGGIWVAVNETWNISLSTLEALGQMFTGTRSATELGGIIRIGAIAGDMAKSGFLALVTFTALLSINLGLINLFPIPMLDGGHLLFYAVEAAKGSPISEQIQEYAFRLGLVILVGIMLFANLNDIVQLVR